MLRNLIPTHVAASPGLAWRNWALGGTSPRSRFLDAGQRRGSRSRRRRPCDRADLALRACARVRVCSDDARLQCGIEGLDALQQVVARHRQRS